VAIIAHLADTHIKNLKYHYEYKIVFEQLYQTLRERKVDYIVHCGDIAHTKTQISPEFVEMCSDFFRSLAEIAPTYIILGNHDGNLKNSSRQDALTPIVAALDLPQLHLLKNSGEIHLNDEVCLNVLSVFDRDSWSKPTDNSKINIALYHGSISNCKTDTNWTMSFGEDDISIFDNFDFAMLGDIHRRQFLDKEGRIWYPGSTVQQNHGETNDKGVLIWDIKSKDDWEIEPIVLQNPKPFVTVQLTPHGKIPKKTDVPQNARLRLVSTNNLPLNVMRRAIDIAKHRFKPESISFLNRASGQRGNVEEITDGLKTENLRDPKVQEELISEYLKDHQVPSETLEKVYELNRTYNKIIEEKEEVSRNVNWKLSRFEFNNLFNYGKGNSVNFDKLNGVIGIFGKNFSGKSSIIDAALYTLFNTTSKNERKNLNVINQNCESGDGKLTIECNNKIYTIKRDSKKYIKRLKGEETLEAKTDLNFEVYDPVTDEVTSLNGVTRNQTDANIRKYFGTIDDFMVSSLASQHGALAFIEEGSTRRKEIIAKFLDLEIFENKFRMAKENSVEAKVLIKKHKNRDYNEEIDQCTSTLDAAQVSSMTLSLEHETLKIKKEKESGALQALQSQIDSAPRELIDIHNLMEQQKKGAITVVSLSSKIREQTEQIENKIAAVVELREARKIINHKKLTEDQVQIDELNQKLKEIQGKIVNINRKEKLLSGIPCGDTFPKCKFIRDANVAVATLEQTQNEMSDANLLLSSLSPEVVRLKLQEYDTLNNSIKTHESKITNLELSREKNKTTKAKTQFSLKTITEKVTEYEENKEAIENLENLMQERKACKKRIQLLDVDIARSQEEVLKTVKLIGSCEQKLENLKEQKQEHADLQNSYAAYDLFMQCMHPNGIAYDVIKKKIPVINQEIARILANIVDFEIFFESFGNKFDIFIKHPLYDERPIEMASGAEKTMAAMAIRLSLLSVSSLPTSDTFILDEPGTALDEENMEGFIRILELVKVYFKNVLLISHLDSLKDCVDMQIVIDKKDGFARVNQ
jgi:exonuclease SbcC